ncbi:MAG: recombinase family protein [Streptosporangiaceae bacterium]
MRLVLAARKSNKVKRADGSYEGISIETQDRRGQQWAERNGHCIVDVAADVKSGTVAPWDRPELRPWVTDLARMALYDGMLAYKNDRLSRGCWDDEARIRLWASENGKRLVIVDGPQWPPRHDGDSWAWEAMAKQARKEWEDIRRRSMDTQADLRERGALVGRWAFGFTSGGDKYDRRLIPTSEGREYVPRIFARVIAGDSLREIAAWLDSEGVKSTQGGKWWPRTVGVLVRNTVYLGERRDADGKVIHRCEPILVTEDGKPDYVTFRKAGEALDNRPKRGPVKPDNRAMLAGAIFCTHCDGDSPMYRVNSATRRKDGTKVPHHYYRCSGRGSQRKGCGNMVLLTAVDGAVNAIITETFSTPVMIRKRTPGHDHSADIAAVEWELRQLPAQGLPEDDEDAKRAELRAERRRLQALPSVPDTWEDVPTGDTYAGLWRSLETSRRGPWLVSKGFRVTADKTSVAVAQGDVSVTVPL